MKSLRTDRAVLLLLAALPFVLHASCIAGNETFFAGDLFGYFLPYRFTLFQALQHGTLPWWETSALSGNPFCASLQGGCFYPPNALYALLPDFFLSFGLLICLHLSLGACGTYLWLREAGHSSGAAQVSALVFLLGGPTLSMVNRLDKLQSLAWWPLALWGLELMADSLSRSAASPSGTLPTLEQTGQGTPDPTHARQIRRRGLQLLIGALCMQILAGGLEVVLMTGIFLGVWSLVVGLRLPSDPLRTPRELLSGWRLELPERTRLLLQLGLGVGVSLLITLPQLTLLNTLLEHSTRASGLALEKALELSLRPADLLGLGLARAFFSPQTLQFFPVAGDASEPRYFYGLYLGGLPLIALLTGALANGQRYGRTRERLACLLLIVLALVLALGRHSELSSLLYAHVPGLRTLRYPEKFLSLLGMAILPLIAQGVDVLGRSARFNRLWLVMVGVWSVLLLLVPGPSLRLLAVGISSVAGGIPALWYERLDTLSSSLIGPLLLTCAGLLALLATRSWPTAASLTPGLVACELAWLNLPLNPTMPVEALAAPPPELSARLAPVRQTLDGTGFAPRIHLLPLYTGEALEPTDTARPVREAYLALKDLLYPNLGQLYGLEVPDGARAIRLSGHAHHYAPMRGMPVAMQVERLEQAGVEVMASLNGPYLAELEGHPQLERLGNVGKLTFFWLKQARRAWLEPTGQESSGLEPTGLEPTRLEATAVEVKRSTTGTGLHVTPKEPNVSAPAGRLVLAENSYPGWLAWVDGRSTPLTPDPLGWRLTLSLPADWKEVHLEFDGSPPTWSWLLSTLGIGLLLALRSRPTQR